MYPASTQHQITEKEYRILALKLFHKPKKEWDQKSFVLAKNLSKYMQITLNYDRILTVKIVNIEIVKVSKIKT